MGLQPLSNHSTTLHYWLNKHNAGDPGAMNELLRFSQERILEYIRQRIRGFRRLAPYVDSQDVLVDVQLKVAKSFGGEPFNDVMHFLRLTARLARHQMIDLTRRYFGPLGPGTNEVHVDADQTESRFLGVTEPQAMDKSPEQHALRTEVEDVIAALPEEHRDLFDLLYHNQMSRADAAEALGVSLSTLDRRWIAAREEFLDRYGKDFPL